MGEVAEVGQFPVVVKAVGVGVSDGNALDEEGDVLDCAGRAAANVAERGGPSAGGGFKEMMCGIVGPVCGAGGGVGAVALEDAAGAHRGEESDAQVATGGSVGGEGEADVFALEGVGDCESDVGCEQIKLGQRGGVGLEEGGEG